MKIASHSRGWYGNRNVNLPVSGCRYVCGTSSQFRVADRRRDIWIPHCRDRVMSPRKTLAFSWKKSFPGLARRFISYYTGQAKFADPVEFRVSSAKQRRLGKFFRAGRIGTKLFFFFLPIEKSTFINRCENSRLRRMIRIISFERKREKWQNGTLTIEEVRSFATAVPLIVQMSSTLLPMFAYKQVSL